MINTPVKIALLLASICLLAPAASADTIVWHASDNPHVINGTYTIAPGTTVIMEPGVIVQVNTNSTLQVDGTLLGQGTAANSVQINSQENYPNKVGGSGRVELSYTIVACPIKPDPSSAYLFSNCTFKMNGHLISPNTVLYSGMPPFVQLDHCTFMGNGGFSSASLDLNHVTLVLRTVSFQNGSYCRATYCYVYLDQFTSDHSSGNGMTLAGEWPVYFNNVMVTNAAGAGLLLGGTDRGINYFTGPNTTLQNNGYPIAVDSGGLLPGSTVPATGNQVNAIYGPTSIDWRGPLIWPNFGIPYIIGNEDTLYFSQKQWHIFAGVAIRMTPGAHIIDYNGGMRLLGQAGAPITLAPLVAGQQWYRIHNNSFNARRFRHCVIEGGYEGLTGGTTVIENSILRNNETATQGASFVSTSQYLNNQVGHSGGSNGSLNVGPNASNIFQGNGVAVRGGSGVLEARYNWWGSPTGPQAPSNPGGTGDPIENDTSVRYQPFLTAPPDVTNSVPLVKLKPPYFNLDAGSRVILSWDSEDENGIAEHRVYFSRAGNYPTSFLLLATLPGNQRSYEWTVPDIGFDPSSSNPFIRVLAVDATGKESYDEALFQIPSGRVSTDIAFTSPVGGETFAPGQQVPVTWTVSNQGNGENSYGYLLLDGYDPISIPLGGWFTDRGTLPAPARMPYVSTDRARILVVTSASLNDVKLFFTPCFKIRPDARVGDQAPAVSLQTPAAGQSFNAGGVIPITWTASDDEGLRSFEIVASFDGGHAWQPVVEGLPGSARSYNWQTPPGLGFADVRVMVLGRDLRFQISSDGAARSFAIIGAMCPAGDCRPSVNITYPANNAVFTKPVSLFISADAAAVNGRSISRVEFYDNGALVATDVSAPYQVALDDPLPGNHVFTAAAVDSVGESRASPPVHVTVNPPESLNPLAIPPPPLTSPTNGQSFGAPATVTISAERPVMRYTLVRMEFYVGTTLVGTDTTSPYSFTWENVPAGRYTVCARAVASTGARSTSTFADITVGAGTPACGCTVSPASAFFSPMGGENTVSVTAAGSCPWQAVSNVGWISVTSGESGAGNGVVGYLVRDNDTGTPRSGTITVGGQTFTVNQDSLTGGDCSFVITPSNTSVGASGNTGTISVLTEERCAWQATSSVSWITITPASGIGNGTVSYSVAANSGGARKATITVGGQTFTVKQKGK